MTKSILHLRCRCGTHFEERLDMPLPASDFISRLLAVRCPQCEGGPKGIGLVPDPNQPVGRPIL